MLLIPFIMTPQKWSIAFIWPCTASTTMKHEMEISILALHRARLCHVFPFQANSKAAFVLQDTQLDIVPRSCDLCVALNYRFVFDLPLAVSESAQTWDECELDSRLSWIGILLMYSWRSAVLPACVGAACKQWKTNATAQTIQSLLYKNTSKVAGKPNSYLSASNFGFQAVGFQKLHHSVACFDWWPNCQLKLTQTIRYGKYHQREVIQFLRVVRWKTKLSFSKS
jgi:hypothetical protein